MEGLNHIQRPQGILIEYGLSCKDLFASSEWQTWRTLVVL